MEADHREGSLMPVLSNPFLALLYSRWLSTANYNSQCPLLLVRFIH